MSSVHTTAKNDNLDTFWGTKPNKIQLGMTNILINQLISYEGSQCAQTPRLKATTVTSSTPPL